MDKTYTVWQLVQCDITLYIFTIHYNVSWKSSILFYVICLPSYRPYNQLEEKKTLQLFCMLCKLCFVSVKKVEKRVSWLLVSVEMAPSEIVVEDNVLVLCSKSLKKRRRKDRFPGHGNLRSRATTPPLPSPPCPAPVPHHQHTQTYSCTLAGPFCCGEERCYLTVPSSIPLVIIYSVSRADLN